MDKHYDVVRKSAVVLSVVVATFACANTQSDPTSDSPTLPKEIVAGVAKYARIDPRSVAIITAVDFKGNVHLLTPEGVRVTPVKEPQPATSIENVEALGVVAFKVNPPCVWITIAGGKYLYC